MTSDDSYVGLEFRWLVSTAARSPPNEWKKLIVVARAAVVHQLLCTQARVATDHAVSKQGLRVQYEAVNPFSWFHEPPVEF